MNFIVTMIGLGSDNKLNKIFAVDKRPLQGVQGQPLEPLRRAVQRHKHTEAQVRMNTYKTPTINKGWVVPPKRMNFRKSSKGAEGHFQSKNSYCRFWTFKEGFLSMTLKKKIATQFSEYEGEGAARG